jgi:heme exporter protein C
MSNAGRIAQWLLLVLGVAVIAAAFVWVQPARGFVGESSRILFFHVPSAWVAALAFLVACITSVRYLVAREPRDDIRSQISAGLGLFFCVLATVTGAVFARIMWNAYWNWDPRQTSITVLLLIYAAYFALRGAVADPDRRATFAAVYAVLAFVTVPFLMFVLPRMMPFSLHPETVGAGDDGGLDLRHGVVLTASVLLFTCMYFWLYNLGCRIERIRRRVDEEL